MKSIGNGRNSSLHMDGISDKKTDGYKDIEAHRQKNITDSETVPLRRPRAPCTKSLVPLSRHIDSAGKEHDRGDVCKNRAQVLEEDRHGSDLGPMLRHGEADVNLPLDHERDGSETSPSPQLRAPHNSRADLHVYNSSGPAKSIDADKASLQTEASQRDDVRFNKNNADIGRARSGLEQTEIDFANLTDVIVPETVFRPRAPHNSRRQSFNTQFDASSASSEEKTMDDEVSTDDSPIPRLIAPNNSLADLEATGSEHVTRATAVFALLDDDNDNFDETTGGLESNGLLTGLESNGLPLDAAGRLPLEERLREAEQRNNQLLAELEAANRSLEMKSMFVRYLSQEMRAPLNAVSMGLRRIGRESKARVVGTPSHTNPTTPAKNSPVFAMNTATSTTAITTTAVAAAAAAAGAGTAAATPTRCAPPIIYCSSPHGRLGEHLHRDHDDYGLFPEALESCCLRSEPNTPPEDPGVSTVTARKGAQNDELVARNGIADEDDELCVPSWNVDVPPVALSLSRRNAVANTPSQPHSLNSSSFSSLTDFANDLEGTCSIALDILNDLLLYEKLEGGALQLELGNVPALSTVFETLKVFEVQAKQMKVKLKLTFDSDGFRANEVFEPTTFIVADKPRFCQVLRNLVSNALKFSPPRSVVTVHLSQCVCVDASDASSARLRISVSDAGPGICPENQKKLFSPTSQFDPNKLQAGGGSGLGLFISKKIMDLHGGSIGVFSEGEGKGATFYVEIPVVNDAQQQQQPSPTESHHCSQNVISPTYSVNKVSELEVGVNSSSNGSCIVVDPCYSSSDGEGKEASMVGSSPGRSIVGAPITHAQHNARVIRRPAAFGSAVGSGCIARSGGADEYDRVRTASRPCDHQDLSHNRENDAFMRQRLAPTTPPLNPVLPAQLPQDEGRDDGRKQHGGSDTDLSPTDNPSRAFLSMVFGGRGGRGGSSGNGSGRGGGRGPSRGGRQKPAENRDPSLPSDSNSTCILSNGAANRKRGQYNGSFLSDLPNSDMKRHIGLMSDATDDAMLSPGYLTSPGANIRDPREGSFGGGSLLPRRILVVDDSCGNRLAATRHLLEEDLCDYVKEASNGYEAIGAVINSMYSGDHAHGHSARELSTTGGVVGAKQQQQRRQSQPEEESNVMRCSMNESTVTSNHHPPPSSAASPANGQFVAILMDKNMPVMDGVTATQMIRRVGYQGCIIGVVGGHRASSTDEVEQFLASGANFVLCKPLDIARLRQLLEELELAPIPRQQLRRDGAHVQTTTSLMSAGHSSGAFSLSNKSNIFGAMGAAGHGLHRSDNDGRSLSSGTNSNMIDLVPYPRDGRSPPPTQLFNAAGRSTQQQRRRTRQHHSRDEPSSGCEAAQVGTTHRCLEDGRQHSVYPTGVSPTMSRDTSLKKFGGRMLHRICHVLSCVAGFCSAYPGTLPHNTPTVTQNNHDHGPRTWHRHDQWHTAGHGHVGHNMASVSPGPSVPVTPRFSVANRNCPTAVVTL